ncbi:MAG: hypothetical protein ACLP4R_08540, partial [Solirubrobacteraceae bacterium]
FTSRGPFAVTESDCKHAPCRLRINAVADDRGFVALKASGSDETRVRADAEPRLLQPRDDAEAGCAKDLPSLGALIPAVRTADLSCAETVLVAAGRLDSRSRIGKQPDRQHELEIVAT